MTKLQRINYKGVAPDNCVTFSHEENSWLASHMGQWVHVDEREARVLRDRGWNLLDDIESGTPVPVTEGE
jgi:hypothetical protein